MWPASIVTALNLRRSHDVAYSIKELAIVPTDRHLDG